MAKEIKTAWCGYWEKQPNGSWHFVPNQAEYLAYLKHKRENPDDYQEENNVY